MSVRMVRACCQAARAAGWLPVTRWRRRVPGQGEGLLAVDEGLDVVAEQRVVPADRVEGDGLPTLLGRRLTLSHALRLGDSTPAVSVDGEQSGSSG